MKRLYILFTAIGIIFPVAVYACTSVIITGSVTPDGRPLMWKHRDTGHLDNRLEHFNGEKYNFIGLVNSNEGPLGKEVWIGSNTAGFSIMNTASYCLKDDDVPASEMDREGVLMYRALEICATLSDFENYLDTLSRPMGVEANFGCIDAFGGAAFYETWNDGYIKRDVNEIEEGYCVVTNFSINGRRNDWKGVERYNTASDIFKDMEKGSDGSFCSIDPSVIMNSLSRSYKHQGDNLYIPRYITSASVIIHGVREGESPRDMVLWTALGYPDSAVLLPVPVTFKDHIPSYMKKSDISDNSLLCDMSLKVKDEYFFPRGRNGGISLHSTESCRRFMKEAEKYIHLSFNELYDKYMRGEIDYDEYIELYDESSSFYIDTINKYFNSFYDSNTYH